MATNKKISDLTARAAGSVTGNETVPVEESSANYKIATKNLIMKAAIDSLTTYTGSSTQILGTEVVPINTAAITNFKQTVDPFIRTRKSFLDNGGFMIWQRGTSITGTAGATPVFTADRWQVQKDVGAHSVSRLTLPTTASDVGGTFYGATVQRTAADADTTTLAFGQTLNSNDARALYGKTVTLSFYAKAGANFSGATLGVQFLTGTTAGEKVLAGFTGSLTVITQTPTLTTSWQRFAYAGLVGTGTINVAGVKFFFTPNDTAGADDSFSIAGVQLEIGSLATPFEHVPYEVDYNIARSYFQVLGGSDTYEHFGSGGANTTSTGLCIVPYQTKKAVPTVTMKGTVGQHGLFDLAGNVTNAATVVAYDRIGVNSVRASVTATGTPFAAGEAVSYMSFNSTAGQIWISAEQ